MRLAADEARPAPASTRAWLEQVEPQLRPLLPWFSPAPLTTAGLRLPDGRPADVFEHFGRDPRTLHMLLFNYDGLWATAQCVGPDRTGNEVPPAWDGFEDVWIPIREDLQLFGRIGWARDARGAIVPADCIVVLPGLFGTLEVQRTRDVCQALRKSGFHALAVELRGAGQTALRYPQWPCNYGSLETGDLLAVSEWLEDQPHVRRTGLIGYCWGANEALLTAFEDGRPDQHPSITPALHKMLRPRTERRHFTAGVLAFSPVLAFEGLLDELQREHPPGANPPIGGLGVTIQTRATSLNYENVGCNFRELIHRDTSRTPGAYPDFMKDGLRYLRLMRYGTLPDFDKLECPRVPTLIVHAANDPLARADFVARQMARVRNPRVAALMLPGGGHDGFSAWAPDYTYSLIMAFFDPENGPDGSFAKVRQAGDACISEATN